MGDNWGIYRGVYWGMGGMGGIRVPAVGREGCGIVVPAVVLVARVAATAVRVLRNTKMNLHMVGCSCFT